MNSGTSYGKELIDAFCDRGFDVWAGPKRIVAIRSEDGFSVRWDIEKPVDRSMAATIVNGLRA